MDRERRRRHDRRRANSAIALAVNEIVRDRNKVLIGSGAGTALLTGEKCSPNTVHWTYDTWAYGHGLARAVAQQGVKSGGASRSATRSVSSPTTCRPASTPVSFTISKP